MNKIYKSNQDLFSINSVVKSMPMNFVIFLCICFESTPPNIQKSCISFYNSIIKGRAERTGKLLTNVQFAGKNLQRFRKCIFRQMDERVLVGSLV